jgi:hypothetical protein
MNEVATDPRPPQNIDICVLNLTSVSRYLEKIMSC